MAIERQGWWGLLGGALMLSVASCSGCGDDETSTGTGTGIGGSGAGGGTGAYDPCANVTCDSPPPPVCVGEATLRTYSGQGQCVDGACVFSAYDDAPCTDCCYGAEVNLTGNPLGGGVGYDDIIDPAAATAVVATADELLGALTSAAAGDVIYVADDAEIDLSGQEDVAIAGGVTLASGRGRSGSQGGLVYCDTFSYPLLRATGEGVRLTGLRLRGPNPDIGDHDYELVVHSGAVWNSQLGFVVDNCELWAWGTHAISLGQGASDAWIHHNYIHHTRRAGLGYGVVLDRSFALIEGNVFDRCRHHIAGTGRPGTGYEASYNLVLEHANGHDFDMHGAADFDKYDTKAIWRFDEGQGDLAEDTSVSGYHPQNDCTLVAMDTGQCWVTGQINTGLELDGVADHLECGDDASLTSAEGSFSFWLRPATLGACELVHLFEDATSSLDVGLDASGHIVVEITDGGTSLVSLASAEAVTTGAFHHVAVTQDGTGVAIYLDGQPTTPAGSNAASWSDHLSLAGAWLGSGPSGAYAGVLDEVRVYSRPLTADEVARHFGGNPDIAGDEILIHHNTFRDVDETAVGIRGVPYVGAHIHHNWFHLTDPDAAIRQSNAIGNMVVEDNHFGPDTPLGTVLPIAAAQLSPPFGRAPTTVSADARASFDPVGHIAASSWDFGDGTEALGATASHEYAVAGRYLVRATVGDELGALVSTYVPVSIAPADSGYWLDFWVKDSYPGPLTGRYEKQAFVGGQLVWSDDVADHEGWAHVSVDVSDLVAGQAQVDVALRARSVTAVSADELIELDVFYDDVTLFGGAVVDGDAESGGAWTGGTQGSGFRTDVSAMEPHTGNWAYKIGVPYAAGCAADAYGELRQTVPILPLELRGSWSFDDGAGALAQDGSLYANHGTLSSMDPEASWTEGIVSHALLFDGADDHVDCGAATSLSSPAGTLLLWLRADALGAEQTIFELRDEGGQSTFSVGLDAEGHIRVVAREGGSATFDLTSTAAVDEGSFQHVAVAQDGTALRIYLDGEDAGADGSNGGAWTDHVTVASAWLGGGQAGYFAGVLDEVRVWSTALGADAIAAEFLQGVPLAHWSFDDGSGTVAADDTGHGHDCTLTAMDAATAWTEGRLGGALAFDGVDDYLDCAAPESLGSSEGSIELWIAPDTLDDDRDLVNVFEDGYENFLLLRRANGGRVLLLIEQGDTPIVSVSSSAVLGQEGWHHVAVTQGGGGTLLYVDGAPVAGSGTNGPGWTSVLALAGAWIGGGHWSNYQGRLDDVTLWARALRADEVAAHAAAGGS